MADYFTVAQARTLKPLDNLALYSDAQIVEARTLVESALEDACSVAFTPRALTDTVISRGTTEIMVRPRLRTVTSVTLDGVAVTLTGVATSPQGVAYLPAGWPVGRLVVTGTHGYDAPPPRVARAALLLAKRFLVASPVNDRAMSHQSPDGTTDFFVTAGRGGATFDVPEANAVVDIYGIRDGLMVA